MAVYTVDPRRRAVAYFAWSISFESRHSDVYFPRKQRKIFHCTIKTEIVLDGDNIRPDVRLGFGPSQPSRLSPYAIAPRSARELRGWREAAAPSPPSVARAR